MEIIAGRSTLRTNRGAGPGISPWLLASARFQPRFRRIRPGAADQTHLGCRMGRDLSHPGAPGDHFGRSRGGPAFNTRRGLQGYGQARSEKVDRALDETPRWPRAVADRLRVEAAAFFQNWRGSRTRMIESSSKASTPRKKPPCGACLANWSSFTRSGTCQSSKPAEFD